MRRIAVIGLGNPDRGDDAIGILVVRTLRERISPDVTILEDGSPVDVLQHWEKFDAVILVDAVCSGSPAGTIQVFDGLHLPSHVRPGTVSSHGFCVQDVIRLGDALGTLPGIVQVVGIEAARFNPGEKPGPEVNAAIEEAVEAVLEQIRRIGSGE